MVHISVGQESLSTIAVGAKAPVLAKPSSEAVLSARRLVSAEPLGQIEAAMTGWAIVEDSEYRITEPLIEAARES
jgi:hypothetical protein